jgi:hypothetical protein
MADAGVFFGATGAVFLGWMAGVTMDELGRRLTDLVEPTRTESACPTMTFTDPMKTPQHGCSTRNGSQATTSMPISRRGICGNFLRIFHHSCPRALKLGVSQ